MSSIRQGAEAADESSRLLPFVFFESSLLKRRTAGLPSASNLTGASTLISGSPAMPADSNPGRWPSRSMSRLIAVGRLLVQRVTEGGPGRFAPFAVQRRVGPRFRPGGFVAVADELVKKVAPSRLAWGKSVGSSPPSPPDADAGVVEGL